MNFEKIFLPTDQTFDDGKNACGLLGNGEISSIDEEFVNFMNLIPEECKYLWTPYTGRHFMYNNFLSCINFRRTFLFWIQNIK